LWRGLAKQLLGSVEAINALPPMFVLWNRS